MRARHLGTTMLLMLSSALAAACAVAPPPTMVPVDGAARRALATDALRSADALVSEGCLDCLLDAYELYGGLAAEPGVGSQAARGAVETAILVAARERELGLEPGGLVERSTSRLSQLAAADRDALLLLMDIVDALPGGHSGGTPASDRDVARRSTAVRRRDEFRAFLEAHANDSPLFGYVWLSFSCAYRSGGEEGVESLLRRTSSWRDTTLLVYRAATCRGGDRTTLQELLAAHPRFVELRYVAGQQAVDGGLIDEAIAMWLPAYQWRSRWPALSQALAEAYLGIDEWDRALAFYDRALELTADEAAALLGKARALTYLGRHHEALAVLDRLLALNGWYPGDARYWRALNETQLERYEAAWADIERAATLIVSADVSKLAGIIAHRLGRPEVARGKFEEAWRRNGTDCEVGVHLSIVQSGLRAWSGALEALGRTATCLETVDRQLRAEIARLRATAEAPRAPGATARQARDVAAREQRLATGERLLATVWFNSAVASYYSARMDDARRFAELVVADDEFGPPARTLLARIP